MRTTLRLVHCPYHKHSPPGGGVSSHTTLTQSQTCSCRVLEGCLSSLRSAVVCTWTTGVVSWPSCCGSANMVAVHHNSKQMQQQQQQQQTSLPGTLPNKKQNSGWIAPSPLSGRSMDQHTVLLLHPSGLSSESKSLQLMFSSGVPPTPPFQTCPPPDPLSKL